MTEIIDGEERERHLAIARPIRVKNTGFSFITRPLYIRRSVWLWDSMLICTLIRYADLSGACAPKVCY
ncbi:MAG: hypothetical protein IJT59_05555, partial [Desulfovibrionaceae bacterium]|nr:hypothetical protein [Desulfovibrionaceae bacterium]